MRYGSCLIIFLFFLISCVNAQTEKDPDITGLWKGNLYNDTTRQYYRYEIAISEVKGKLTGFTHTWFILDDKQYYGVKKVKVRRKDGKVIVEDEELIANNYPVKPAKNVRQLNVLTLELKDSIMIMSGPFTTNMTKDYRPLTGSINVQRRNDFWQSALVPHLEELKLARQLSFVQKEDIQLDNAKASVTALPVSAVETENAIILKKAKGYKPSTVNEEKSIASTGIVNSDKKTVTVPALPKEERKPAAPVVAKIPAPAEDVLVRNTELQQTVYFKSDSLQLSLYDNGEIDGDTVSVLMNGKVIFAKERLSTNAVRKTISIDPSQDSIQLVMYAENLGTIAPNTGLLVVRDGKEIYEIRFSGDLKKNAAIVFRRKKL